MDLWDFLAASDDSGATDPPPCPYCGAGTLSDAVDNGRATRLTCDTCGGTAVAPYGAQFAPDLIGQQDNHPATNPDPDSGGVGGAANHGVVHTVVQRSTSALESSVLRVYHNDPGCRVCNRPEGLHIAAPMPVHPNPLTGEDHWYHGTHYHPQETKDPKGFDRARPGGTIIPIEHAPRSVDRVEASWNTDLGTHFSSMHEVANNAFARPDSERHAAARVAHTSLHMANPIHFHDESAMNSHAIDWARENNMHYLPRKKAEHSKFRQGDYAGIQHKDGTNYSYLEEHHSALPNGDRAAISALDNHGSGKIDEHADLSDRTKLKVKEQWLETHPKRDEISRGYQQHLKDQGHDGIIYGNQHEGPMRHTCAIAFHDTPMTIHKWEWMHPKGMKTVHDMLGTDDTDKAVDLIQHPGHGRGYFHTSARVPFEVTATWADVRTKAQRISAEGGVHIAVSSGDGIGGTVQGDSDLYQTMLGYVPGSRKVGFWQCGCKWASYAWGRSAPFRRYEGRMCAHALAMQFEALKQHAFGRGEVEEHSQRPSWMRDRTVVVHHQRGTDRAPAVDHRRAAGLLQNLEQLAGGLQVEAADEPADPGHPPAYAVAVVGTLLNLPQAGLHRQLMSLGYDTDSASRLLAEARADTFMARQGTLTAGLVDEFKRDILLMDPEKADHGHAHAGPDQPGVHRTEDAREHAPEHGWGVPLGQGDSSVCTQCHGQGCGACGGAGDVDLDGLSHIPDQNADAGPYSKGKGMGGGGIPTFSSRHLAEYSSYDWQGDPVVRSPNRHVRSQNPGSTGWATAADPAGWSSAVDNSQNFDPIHGAAKPKSNAPTHAGVALMAADTGRMVALQRSFSDPKDPARGKWEFPGGGIEDGDHTSLHAGIREHEEETGQPFPAGGEVAHTWRNGPYRGHLVVIPHEHQFDPKAERQVKNPDDDNEVVAWRHPDSLRGDPELREEAKTTPWSKLKSAGMQKAAAMGFEGGWLHDKLVERALRPAPDPGPEPEGGEPSPWESHHPTELADHSRKQGCVKCGDTIAAFDSHRGVGYCRKHIDEIQSSNRPIAEEKLSPAEEKMYPPRESQLRQRLRPVSVSQREMNRHGYDDETEYLEDLHNGGLDRTRVESLMHTAPEPALPTTEGEGDDDSTSDMGATPGERYRSRMSPEIGSTETSSVPNLGTTAAIVAAFQNSPGAAALDAPTPAQRQSAAEGGHGGDPGGGDIAAAAREHLAKTGMKDFTGPERAALISEGEGGPRNRNADLLRIADTHYAEIDDEELTL